MLAVRTMSALRLLAAHGTSHQVALRSRIILASAESQPESAIAKQLETNHFGSARQGEPVGHNETLRSDSHARRLERGASTTEVAVAASFNGTDGAAAGSRPES
jgi:hypothetical protein